MLPDAANDFFGGIGEAELLAALDGTAPSALVVDVSTGWCLPCRLLAPLIPKLAAEVALPTVVVDGDAAPAFRARFGVEGFPEVLFFRGGEPAHRVSGFTGYDELRAAFLRLAGRTDAPSGAERAFREAAVAAAEAFREALAGPDAAVDRLIEGVAPELDALQAAMRRAVEAGTATEAEARAAVMAERTRLFAPFQPEMDALDAATEAALTLYAAAVAQARARFDEAASPKPLVCRPGDVLCRGT